jgi:hypothetical protein
MTPRHGYAIVPAETSDPIAVFFSFEDAVDWALARIGHDQFRIRTVALNAPPASPAAAVS